ncbi:MAG: CDP-diacylglycerol--glycerol-3-phosphate 3-phosphatidyltransferase [Candidatus Omnitrophica bacterium]|nr:CDP-diacylglycerol--glycerol-3-phosphate 3-phosphatidyltransferase [Candidatus Omnitrophota bacterium]
MNLPNKLTILRIILAFVFIVFLFLPGIVFKVAALVTFVLASITDALDGYLAKKNNQITDFGRLMDPIADKVLILSAFLAFVQMQLVPAWMVVIILFREVAVTGLRLFALGKHKVLAADIGGKHKTACQVFAVFMILLLIVFREAGPKVFKFWSACAEAAYRNAVFVVMFITIILTLISGISYLIKNREVYSNAKES